MTKNINIFISSTFNDMQSERDIIRKQIVPKLKEELADYHVSIQVTDLRWGVDTSSVEEGEREAKVLHVCMDAIQNSRPYFIALLGERYGWIPSPKSMENIKRTLSKEQQLVLGDVSDSMSVTEMEILLGALGNQDLMPHSFFCFRSQGSYNDMPSEKKIKYVDSLSSDEEVRKNAIRLEKLKQRIEHECEVTGLKQNIVRYDAQWVENDETGMFDHLESLADQLYALIYEDILSDLEIDDADFDGYQKKNSEYNRFITFVESHTEDFQGREPLIKKFSEFFLKSRELSSVLNGITGYFLTGFSGCGKSSLFSKLYQHLTETASQHSFYILAHSAGITPQSVIVEKMISAWCLQMKKTLGDDIDEDTDDEDRSFNWASQLLDEFKQLISRIQVRGLQPIVLIDSLDSFETNNIIKDFDFLPYNVPFVCTTLPGYADDIVKKHPSYQCYNMDDFNLDEAKQVITSVLKKNFKELAENLQEQLLGIKKANGHPAYESPLWLRLSLDILMELGEEDFNRIHNIRQFREDAKIGNYLSQIISEFPPEAGDLFEYWIKLTCRYFNPVLTRKSLTYIAIAQYGIKEDDIAELIGKEWSQLDFVSLRYWMRNYIQCNSKDHRWFFSHAILRQTLMQQSPGLLKKCQDKFYGHLIENLVDDGEKKELVHQLIVRQETYVFYKNIKKLEDVFIQCFLYEYKTNPELVTIFMRKYIDQHYIEGSRTISDVECKLLGESRESEDTSYFDAAKDLYNYHLSHFSEDDFTKSLEVIEYFFFAHDAISEHLYYFEEPESYIEFFQKLVPIYELMKSHFGEDSLPRSLSYSYFSYWRIYIRKVRELSKYESQYHELYCENISNYLDEYALWCCDNEDPDGFYEKVIGIVNDDWQLSTDERIVFLQQMQCLMLKLIKEGCKDERRLDDVIGNARQIIKIYVNLFDAKDEVSETTLMAYLSYFPSPEEKSKRPTYQIPNDRPEEKTVVISFGSPPENEEEGEWHSIDLDSMDPDSLSKQFKLDDDDEETDGVEEDSEIPTDDDIKALEQELDDYLRVEKKLYDKKSKDDKKRLKEKSKLYRRLALMYLKAGYTEKGNNLLSQLGHLLVGFIVNMDDNYALGDDDSKDIIKHGALLAKLGHKEEQLKQAEAISDALFHSYYHHEDGYSQRRIYNYLLKLYEDYSITDKKITLLEHMYEIAIRNHIERRFDSYDFYFHDLGYVRPIFKTLFKELKTAGRIQEAVIALERWVDLCHWNYIDEEDSAGYDDLDNAYDMLASLYDGTPTITEGMNKRKSVFLKDPYIMVCLDNKWGYINHEGQVAIPLIYSGAWKAEPECLSVSRDGQWGYIDLHGNEITFFGDCNFQFDVAVPVRNGWGRVCVNHNWAEFHIPDIFIPITIDCYQFFDTTDGMTKVGVETEHGYRQDFLLQDGESLLFDGTKHSVKTPNQGVIVADWYNPDEEENDGHRTAIYDMQGNELTKFGRYSAIVAFGKQNLSPAYTVDNRAGYVNRSGQEVSSFQYKRCRPFAYGLGAVCKEGKYPNGRWGFVNEQGEEVVVPQYIDVGDFHEGLAWVCLDNSTRKGFNWRGGKFGFINTIGEMVIPAIYDDVSSFYEGKALVWQDNQAIYINKRGETVGYLFPPQKEIG